MPRLTTKIGEKDYKKYEKEIEEEKKKEETLMEKIRGLRKEKNKERHGENLNPENSKRRKVNETEYRETGKNWTWDLTGEGRQWGEPGERLAGEKRDSVEEHKEKFNPKKKM